MDPFVGSGDWSFIPRCKSFPEPEIKPEPHESSLCSGKQTLEGDSPRVKSRGLDSCNRLERKRQSNRESAKRMRKLRQRQLSTLQEQVKELEETKNRLVRKAAEDEQVLKQIPILVQQCKQLREDKRRLMELLSGRTILGMDLLGPAVGRSISLDSTVTASDLRVMCARAGLDQGGLRGDPCVGIPGDSDTYDTATHRALLLEQAVGATQLERFDALFKDKLGSGDY